MEQQHTEEDFKNIAKQLACPEGDHGIKTGEMMNASNIGMTHAAIDSLALQNDDMVLEIGHGNGGHISYLLSKAENLHYFGADISETMIAEAKKLNQAFLKNGSIHFQLIKGMDLPFADEQFDKGFTVNTIYFWENPTEYLKEIRNVLCENGLFVIAFADKTFMEKLPFTKYGFTLYDLEEVKKLLIDADFKIYNTRKKTEQIKSNTGFMVIRDYYVIEAFA